MLLSLLTLFACTKDEPLDSGDSGDTDVEADADTDADSDTDTDADTDVVGSELTYVIDGEVAGTLTLTQLNLFSEEPGDVWQSTAVTDTTQSITVPIPPPDHLFPVDPQNLPGLNGAFYAATVEIGGSHGHSATALTAFLDGDIPNGLGWDEGWNALVFTEESEVPENIGVDAIPITALPYNEELTIGGTASVDAERWGLLPGALFEGQAVTSVLFDEPLGETWTVTLTGAPPEDHEIIGEEGLTFELPLAYDDVDASGGLSEGDTPVSPACTVDGETALAIWVSAPSDGQTAWFALSEGQSLGWTAIGAGPNDQNVVLEGDALTTLAFDGTCSLE